VKHHAVPVPVSHSSGIVITSPGDKGEPVSEVSPGLGLIVITEKMEIVIKL